MIAHIVKRAFQGLIRIYQKTLSPIVGSQCRFAPTCSHYSYDAFERHGVIKGLFLTIRRLLKCHPWVKCEWHDPVPETFEWKQLWSKTTQTSK
jgi:putative membrane protein insertion efficiency factor